jgi:drug/metabolite transporter (DMT)-like permease
LNSYGNSESIHNALQDAYETMNRNALLAAGVTSLMWGLTGIFVRLLPTLPALTVTAGRLLIALIVVLPVLVLLRGSHQRFISILSRPMAYIFALLLAGYYLLATTAFQMAPVAEVALLLSTPPLFVLGFRSMRGDIPTRAELTGAVVAVAGIGLILVPKMSFADGVPIRHLLGSLLAMSAAGLTALYAYLYRILAERDSAPDIIGVSVLTFAVGSTILLLMVGLMPAPVGLETLNSRSVWIFLGLGVLCTAVSSIGYAFASKRLSAGVTTTISLFIPLFAGIFAFLILDERLSPTFIPGGLLVLGGIFLILQPSSEIVEKRV